MEQSRSVNRLYLLIALCALIVLLALAAAGGALIARFAATNSNRAANLATWHIVLCGLEIDSNHNRKTTAAQKRNAAAFLDKALREIHAPPCKPASTKGDT